MLPKKVIEPCKKKSFNIRVERVKLFEDRGTKSSKAKYC